MATVTMSTKFPAEMVTEMFNKVRGKSSLAKLVGADPIPFTGVDVFTFSMDNKVSVVGEGGAKPAGGATVGTVQVRPLKVEYGVRVSDEFMIASEERQIEILRPFTEGFAKKLARALDMMAIAKVNPKDGVTSALITNDFTAVTNRVLYTPGNAEGNIDDAAVGTDIIQKSFGIK